MAAQDRYAQRIAAARASAEHLTGPGLTSEGTSVVLAADEATLDLLAEALAADGAALTCVEATGEDAASAAVRRAQDEGAALALVACASSGSVRVWARTSGALEELDGDALAEVALDLTVRRSGTSLAGHVLGVTVAVSDTLRALAEDAGMAVWETLPGHDNAERLVGTAEGAGERLLFATDASRHVLASATDPATNALFACLLATRAATDARVAGQGLGDALLACRRRTCFSEVGVVRHDFSAADEAAMHLMGLRAAEPELICHMMVTDTRDYLRPLPMPGNPTAPLPFADALGWDLSDGSRLLCYAQEQAVFCLCSARGDSAAEAHVVRLALEQEAHEIITHGLPHA